MRHTTAFLLAIVVGCDPLNDEGIAKCREWRNDILACKNETCCKAVRFRRPHGCWPPSREDHPDLCAVSE